LGLRTKKTALEEKRGKNKRCWIGEKINALTSFFLGRFSVVLFGGVCFVVVVTRITTITTVIKLYAV